MGQNVDQGQFKSINMLEEDTQSQHEDRQKIIKEIENQAVATI